jgi:hypothetical protein
MFGSSWVAAELAASQEGLSSVKLEENLEYLSEMQLKIHDPPTGLQTQVLTSCSGQLLCYSATVRITSDSPKQQKHR